MSRLSAKTRGNSSPQEKPRVYFSCHPEDFGAYFEVLSEEILKTQNCAIWYESEWDESEDHVALESQLSQMQLFVVPITTNYLRGDCRAIQFEFGYAMEQRIPVLPIMMESGLTDYFTERMERIHEGYGKLQVLDRTAKDLSKIPYAEKLEKQLTSILVSDETIRRVQEAFDAYIFLSYRKKDRTEAQGLMRLIHSIPEFQDIAIWYDEFLVPGEQWSDTIANAMAKSGLVTLAVTEHLTEEGNYIICHEYPDAVKTGKKIVPAKLTETDVKKLEELFPGLPALVDGRSKSEMKAAIGSIAHQENDRDPTHNFLIGLAYLNAIDVERDTERAVRLITSAAEAWLPEAIEQLISMYRSGNGVQADENAAIAWQERVVRHYKREYRKNPTESVTEQLVLALGNLAVLCRKAGKINESKAVAEMMMKVCKNWEERSADNINPIYYLCLSYEVRGEIEQAVGNYGVAHKWYESSQQYLESIVHEDQTPEITEHLCVVFLKLGTIGKLRGSLTSAKYWYKLSLQYLECLNQTSYVKKDLASVYVKLGEIEESYSEQGDAEKWYQKAIPILKTLVREIHWGEAYQELSAAYDKLGDNAIALGNKKAAYQWYEKSLSIRRNLERKLRTADSRWDLSVSYDKIGDYWLSCTHADQDARDCYEKSLDIRMRLAEEVHILRYVLGLSSAYHKLGDVEMALGNPAEAKEWHEMGLQIAEQAADETKTVEVVHVIPAGALAYITRKSDLRKGWPIPDEAYEAAGETIIPHDKTVVHYEADVRQSVSRSCRKLGDCEQALGNIERAAALYRKSCSMLEPLAKETRVVENRENLALCYSKLGCVEQTAGHLQEAQSWHEKALSIRMAIAKKTQTVDAYDDLGMSYYQLWSLNRSENESYLRKAVSIFKRLHETALEDSRYCEVYETLLGFLHNKEKAKKQS